jgi:hypothetical protein
VNDEKPACPGAELARQSSEIRSWSAALKAESARLAGLVAETEDLIAGTLARLASSQPRHEHRLLEKSVEAAEFAAYVRGGVRSRSGPSPGEADGAR